MTRVLALAALVAGPCGAAAVAPRPGPRHPAVPATKVPRPGPVVQTTKAAQSALGYPALPELVQDLEGQLDQAEKSVREELASARGLRNRSRGLREQAKVEAQEHPARLEHLRAQAEEATKESMDAEARLEALGQPAAASLANHSAQLDEGIRRNGDLARRLAAHKDARPRDRVKFRSDVARLAARTAKAKQELALTGEQGRSLVGKIANLTRELPLMQGKLAEEGQQHAKLVQNVETLAAAVDEEMQKEGGRRARAAAGSPQQAESALRAIRTQVADLEAENQALAETLQQKRAAQQAAPAVRRAAAGIANAYSMLLRQLAADTPRLFSS